MDAVGVLARGRLLAGNLTRPPEARSTRQADPPRNKGDRGDGFCSKYVLNVYRPDLKE